SRLHRVAHPLAQERADRLHVDRGFATVVFVQGGAGQRTHARSVLAHRAYKTSKAAPIVTTINGGRGGSSPRGRDATSDRGHGRNRDSSNAADMERNSHRRSTPVARSTPAVAAGSTRARTPVRNRPEAAAHKRNRSSSNCRKRRRPP